MQLAPRRQRRREIAQLLGVNLGDASEIAAARLLAVERSALAQDLDQRRIIFALLVQRDEAIERLAVARVFLEALSPRRHRAIAVAAPAGQLGQGAEHLALAILVLLEARQALEHRHAGLGAALHLEQRVERAAGIERQLLL